MYLFPLLTLQITFGRKRVNFSPSPPDRSPEPGVQLPFQYRVMREERLMSRAFPLGQFFHHSSPHSFPCTGRVTLPGSARARTLRPKRKMLKSSGVLSITLLPHLLTLASQFFNHLVFSNITSTTTNDSKNKLMTTIAVVKFILTSVTDVVGGVIL